MANNEQISDGDLFNNPMIVAALAALSDEDKEKYKKIGEQIHSIDYTNGQAEEPAAMVEGAAYLVANLRSGLHPSMMSDMEHKLMVEMHGGKWYTRWGYVEEDLKNIVTVTPNLIPEQEASAP
jgi:hypothetical protein